MRPLFGALILISMLFFDEIEASGSLKKLNTKESPSSKEDKRRISVFATPRRLTPEPKARERILKAQFQPNPDSSGETALHLYGQYYAGRTEPSAESGSKALALYATYKQKTHHSDTTLQPNLPEHGEKKSEKKSSHVSIIVPEASNFFRKPHLSQDSQLLSRPNQNNQPHTNPKNSVADENIRLYQDMLRDFPKHPYYGGPARSSGSGRQS